LSSDLSQHSDADAIQRLKVALDESKRKQGEYLLQNVSDKALKKEYKRRGL
tara:strand:- start:65 stop:217 length:153 start_codon:yes stop_codon:yes gene_type:complete